MGTSPHLQAVLDRMDREGPIARKNHLKAWGVEAARLFMQDEGFRQRTLRQHGLDHIDRHDHESIAAAFRGPIHGDFLRGKNRMEWWSDWCPHSRWVLCGYRVAALRMARAAKRRAVMKVVL